MFVEKSVPLQTLSPNSEKLRCEHKRKSSLIDFNKQTSSTRSEYENSYLGRFDRQFPGRFGWESIESNTFGAFWASQCFSGLWPDRYTKRFYYEEFDPGSG